MRKILIIASLLLIIAGCEPSRPEIDEFVDFISVKEVDAKLKDKDTFMFVICDTSSEFCDRVAPMLKDLKENFEISIPYLDMGKFSSSDIDRFYELAKDEYLGEEIIYSPRTFYIVDGELKEFLEWTADARLVNEVYEKYIK